MDEIKKVLVSDPLSNKGLELLGRAQNLKYDIKPGLSPEELKKIIPEYDAIIVRSETKLSSKIIEAGDRLKGIGRAGTEACIAIAKDLPMRRVFALTYKPAFFERLGFHMVDKLTLPEKVWKDCLHCSKLYHCDEVAVLLEL